jgi:surface antigen
MRAPLRSPIRGSGLNRGLRFGLALTVATAAAAAAPGKGSPKGPVVNGYPYASSCPEAGRKDLVDRWGMYACNCTSYVAWALQANHQRTSWFIGGAMDAWNWPHVARLRGLKVVSRPTVRAVAVWPRLARPFGHVAYVTHVDPDGRYDVSEYNLPAKGSRPFTFDTRSHVSPHGAVFIQVPDRG